jgi:hypothetical protein
MILRRPILCFHSPAFHRLRAVALAKPIDVLNLSVRAINGLENAGITSVAQLLDRARVGTEAPRNLGEKTCLEIEVALSALSACVKANGSVDWNRYRILRESAPAGAAPSQRISIRLRSAALLDLVPSARAQPLAVLHLSPRTINGLNRERIRSLGEFVDRLGDGLGSMWAIGPKSLSEIQDSYEALSSSVKPNGEIDWVSYATSRGFLVLPRWEDRSISTCKLTAEFPGTLFAAIESTFGSFESGIFRRYALRDTSSRMSSADSSKESGYSKQGISLIRNKTLAMLRGAIFEHDYRGCRFRFRDSFTAPLRRLREALGETDVKVLSYTEWQRVLRQTRALEPEQLGPSEERILSLLVGYRILPPVSKRDGTIVLPKGVSISPVTAALGLMSVLLKTSAGGMSEDELLEMLRLAGHHFELDPSELFRMLRGMLDLEEAGANGNLLRLRTESLVRQTDKIERILRDRGIPMKALELIEALNRLAGKRRGTQNPIHFRKTLASDRRFKAIGRSGWWALREWDYIDGRTAAEISAELLRTSGNAMTEAELHRLISARRPIKFHSLGSMLRDDGRFRRIGARTWELKPRSRGKQ